MGRIAKIVILVFVVGVSGLAWSCSDVVVPANADNDVPVDTNEDPIPGTIDLAGDDSRQASLLTGAEIEELCAQMNSATEYANSVTLSQCYAGAVVQTECDQDDIKPCADNSDCEVGSVCKFISDNSKACTCGLPCEEDYADCIENGESAVTFSANPDCVADMQQGLSACTATVGEFEQCLTEMLLGFIDFFSTLNADIDCSSDPADVVSAIDFLVPNCVQELQDQNCTPN